MSLAELNQMNPRAGFHWWPIRRSLTPHRFQELWRGLRIGLPPIGRGNRWVNVATPLGTLGNIDGVLTNFTIPACWVGGYQEAYALEFDGVNDQVDIADFAARRCFDIQDRISFDAWIFPYETNNVVIAAKRDAANFAWELRINADPNNNLEAYINAVGNVATSAASIPEYQWTHVAFRYDRQNIQCFVNGYRDGTAAFAAAVNLVNTSITLGCNLTAAPAWYDGKMSIARLWARRLTDGDFEDLFLFPYAMFQYDNRLCTGTNWIGFGSMPMNRAADGSIGRMALDLCDTRVPSEMDSKSRTAGTARAYPRQPNLQSTTDAGPRTMHEMTGLAHGWIQFPHNANARGLDLRKDEEQRTWPP